MLQIDRINVDQASLWKIMMIEVVGSFGEYFIFKQLRIGNGSNLCRLDNGIVERFYLQPNIAKRN